jgi:ribosomal protein S18 acetylase RimI-like enzyme
MSNTLMHFLEELAANAWPPATTQMVDGWRLRYNENVTQRANSVLPNDISGEMRLDERLELAEDFYARHNMRTRYQVCPASLPSELDAALAARSYARISDTSVQIAQTENVIEQTGGNKPPGFQAEQSSAKPRRFSVTVSGFSDTWMDTYAQGGHMSAHEHAMRRGIVERIGPRAGFALASLEGQPVAVGLGVTERGWTGIFCMETQPAFRRQGAATLILGALAQWGQENGATQMYLQVMVNNAPACALYQRAGFSALYTYWYREAGK